MRAKLNTFNLKLIDMHIPEMSMTFIDQLFYWLHIRDRA